MYTVYMKGSASVLHKPASSGTPKQFDQSPKNVKQVDSFLAFNPNRKLSVYSYEQELKRNIALIEQRNQKVPPGTDVQLQQRALSPMADPVEKKKKPADTKMMVKERYSIVLTEKQMRHRTGLFIGTDIAVNRQVAVKLFGGRRGSSSKSSKPKKGDPVFDPSQQYNFYVNERDIMHKIDEETGFTKLIESGFDEHNNVYYIVMNKLDEDLDSIIKRTPKGHLSLQTVVNIGLELLNRLEILHSYGILHRDLKPKNIMFDMKKHQLTLIDFGLSGKYLTQHMAHIPYRNTGTLLGTPMFASNNALFGKEISRRDDIESMMYILIFCLTGTLPWHGIINIDFLKTDNARARLLNMRDPEGVLCKDLPLEFRSLLTYAQELEFEDEPDYERIETIFTLLKEKNRLRDSYEWDRVPQQNFDSQCIKLEPKQEFQQSRQSQGEEQKVINSDVHYDTQLRMGGDSTPEVSQPYKRRKSKIIKKIVKIVHQHHQQMQIETNNEMLQNCEPKSSDDNNKLSSNRKFITQKYIKQLRLKI